MRCVDREVTVLRMAIRHQLHPLQPWISQNQEIRPAAHAFHRIRGVDRTRGSLYCRHGGQMTARRESHHSNPGGINMEIRRMGAHKANGSGTVEQWSRKPGIGPDAILKDERCHSTGREP
jgi:hypothetical protein